MGSRIGLALMLAAILSSKARVRTSGQFVLLAIGCYVFMEVVLVVLIGYAAVTLTKGNRK